MSSWPRTPDLLLVIGRVSCAAEHRAALVALLERMLGDAALRMMESNMGARLVAATDCLT